MIHFTLTQLEYLVAVDTHRHFVTAAEKSFVTQPTLSMQLKKLEGTLGVILFDRSRQPIVPTVEGKRIIEQARVILAEAHRVENLLQEIKETMTGELVIGIIPTLSPYLLPRFSGTFLRKFPEVHLKIKELLTEEIIEGLRNETLDLGILALPLNENGIQEQALFYEPFSFYLSPRHPAYQQKDLTVEESVTGKFWLLKEGNCFRNQQINLCGLSQWNSEEPWMEFESGSISTLIKMVDTEGGLTLVPELAVLDLPENQKNQVKPIRGESPLRKIGLVTSRNASKHRLIKALAPVITESVPPNMRKKGEGRIIEWKVK